MLVQFANTTNLFSSPAMAQGYNDNNNNNIYNNYYGDNDIYSKYPTEGNNMNVEQVHLKASLFLQ